MNNESNDHILKDVLFLAIFFFALYTILFGHRKKVCWQVFFFYFTTQKSGLDTINKGKL